MAVTISPSAAIVNAATKPYTEIFSAVVDFYPSYHAWYVDGVLVHFGADRLVVGGGDYQVAGPSIVVAAAPKTIRVDVQPASGAMQTTNYTTADQRTPPSITATLRDQKDGVPIVDGRTVPMTPVASPVAGETRIALAWSYGAQGEQAVSDIVIRVVSANETDDIGRVRINWGDGSTSDVDCNNVSNVLFERGHTYTGVTGALSVVATQFDAGDNPGVNSTIALAISQDATGWRAGQYRIQEYQDQVGFRQTSVVGWRGITNEPSAFTLYNKLRGHQYNYRLQLRESDVTGRPIRTSALSVVGSAGPW